MGTYIMSNGKQASTGIGRLCYCQASGVKCGRCLGNPAVEGDGKGNVFCLCCGGVVQVVGRSVDETIRHCVETYREGSGQA